MIKLGRSSTSNEINTTNSGSQNTNQDQNSQLTNERYLQLIVSKCKCEFYIIDFDDRLPNSEEDTITNEQMLNYSNENFSNLSTSSHFNNYNRRKDHLNTSFNDCIDCITLIQHDLNLCTNSQQYKMIMTLVNNLVLYFRPRRKQILDKQKSIKFNLQLSQGNLSSLKEHIQLKQLEAKQLLFKLRMLERKLYHLREKIESEMNDYNMKYNNQQRMMDNKIYIIHELRLENKSMDKEYKECKKMLNDMMDELNISINCYKEMMLEQRASNLATQILSSNSTHNTSSSLRLPKSSSYQMRNSSPINKASSNLNLVDLDQQAQESILNNEIGRRYEVWFKQTQWKLLNDNNESLIAKLMNKNFLYTKVNNQQELDCVEHNLEIESCQIKDLTSSAAENGTKNINVLSSFFDAQSSSNLFNDYENEENYDNSSSPNNTNKNQHHKNSMFRIYCKERPPVGIPVIEHLEVNVAPLSIKLTNRFFKAMMNYFFDITPGTNQGQSAVQTNIQQPLSSTIQRNFHRHSYHVGINNNNNNSNLNTSINLDELNSSNLSTSTTNILNSTRTNGGPGSSTDVNSPTKIKSFLNTSGHVKKPSQSSISTAIINNTTNTTTTASQDTNTNNQENQLQIDDIEIMKQRSANNNTFLCIKITEIQLLVSYKGGDKEKNLKDLNNVSLLFPLFEVHDKTWTWLDMINALKSHVKKALLSQAIKHKLIKIPIQPVNKLISLSRRNESLNNDSYLMHSSISNNNSLMIGNSNDISGSSMNNKEIDDEKEKMTVIKLFGTKLIEKKSSQPYSSTSLYIDNQMSNSFKMNKGELSNNNSHQMNDDFDLNDNSHHLNSTGSSRTKKGLKSQIKKKIFDKFSK